MSLKESSDKTVRVQRTPFNSPNVESKKARPPPEFFLENYLEKTYPNLTPPKVLLNPKFSLIGLNPHSEESNKFFSLALSGSNPSELDLLSKNADEKKALQFLEKSKQQMGFSQLAKKLEPNLQGQLLNFYLGYYRNKKDNQNIDFKLNMAEILGKFKNKIKLHQKKEKDKTLILKEVNCNLEELQKEYRGKLFYLAEIQNNPRIICNTLFGILMCQCTKDKNYKLYEIDLKI